MSWQSSLDAVIRNLRAEEQNLERNLERIREALSALNGVGRGAKGRGIRQRRLSAAGREAIARAARKRWAKWRAEQKAKN